MTARSSQLDQRPDPAQRFLTDFDRTFGPSSVPLSTWPATVLYWTSQMRRFARILRTGSWRSYAVERQGEAG